MKRIVGSTVVAAAAAVAVFSLSAKPPAGPHGHGTDILHFSLRKTMNNEGAETNAAGTVNAKQNQQGKANNQKLDITLSSLGTNATYQLLALIDDDINLTAITNFTADANGADRKST